MSSIFYAASIERRRISERAYSNGQCDAIDISDCLLDLKRRELRRSADIGDAEPQDFDLIVFLIQSWNRVASKDKLLAAAAARAVIGFPARKA